MLNWCSTIGCFKPQDEEPYGPCNPRGFRGELKMVGLHGVALEIM